MVARPTLADPEVASATFRRHLDELWGNGRPGKLGWGRIDVDPLTIIIALPAIRSDGTRDWYFIRLGGEYYDAAPPTVTIVNPADWSVARAGTRWFPTLGPTPDWLGLHDAYGYPDGQARQLVCFTFAAQYYMTDHSPPETTVWKQGRHTLAMTLNRLAEALGQPYYQKPSG